MPEGRVGGEGEESRRESKERGEEERKKGKSEESKRESKTQGERGKYDDLPGEGTSETSVGSSRRARYKSVVRRWQRM